jgi:hypothetical protein
MSKMMKYPIRTIGIVLTLLLGACNTNPFSEQPDKLTTTAKTFEGTVRWGNLQQMYAFLKKDPSKPVEIAEGLDNVRVTSYELISPLSKESDMRWRQTVLIDYVLIDRQVVRQVVDEQVWFSDDDGVSWYREQPLPAFN